MLIKQTKDMTDSERIAVENSNNQYLQALSYVAVGTIFPYAGAEVPDTFMICDGSALDTTEYADLFSIIGYTFGGSGDTFNIPDLRGKTLVGLNSNDSDFDAVGKSAGEKTHQLTVAEMPSHSHMFNPSAGIDGINFVVPTGTGGEGVSSISKEGTAHHPGHWANDTWGTYAVGGSKAHNNMPPFIAAYCWQRIQEDEEE